MIPILIAPIPTIQRPSSVSARAPMGLILLCCFGATASQSGPFTYTVTNAEVTITRYTGDGGSVVVPSTILRHPVTSIGEFAFNGCTGLTNLTLSTNLTTIGDGAFGNCAGLKSVTLPDRVTSIADWAFEGCVGLTSIALPTNLTRIGDTAFGMCAGLQSITLPDSVTSVGTWAFHACTGLTNVTIGNGLTNIDDLTFLYCTGLTTITLPRSLTSMGVTPFAGCYGLTNFTVDPLNPNYSDRNGVVFSKDQTVLVAYPCGRVGGYEVPEGVRSVGKSAFEATFGLTTLSLPESLTNIAMGAFLYCTGLANLTIPNGVTTIEHDAFAGCGEVASITLGTNLTSLGSSAFDACSNLTTIAVPSSLTNIAPGAFGACPRLTNITVHTLNPSYTDTGGVLFSKEQTALLAYPDGIPGGYAVPEGVTRIEEGAFDRWTSLASLTVPKSVTNILEGSFAGGSNLTNISVDPLNRHYCDRDGVLFDKEQRTLFQYPGARAGTYTVPDGVTTLGDYAFYGCNRLTSVTIPRTATNIGSGTFCSCNSLTNLYFAGNAPTFNPFSFDLGDANPLIYYLLGATGWDSVLVWAPTAIWDPQVSTTNSNFGVRSNRFGFTVNGAADLPIVVEACTNLANPVWEPVGTNTLTQGAFDFSHREWTNSPARFYRLRSP